MKKKSIIIVKKTCWKIDKKVLVLHLYYQEFFDKLIQICLSKNAVLDEI